MYKYYKLIKILLNKNTRRPGFWFPQKRRVVPCSKTDNPEASGFGSGGDEGSGEYIKNMVSSAWAVTIYRSPETLQLDTQDI